MANSILTLPGKFEDGTVYALKGKTLNEWVAALQADRVICGPGQTEYQQPYGRVILGGIATGYIHPWRVTLKKKLNVWVAEVVGGRVFNHELACKHAEVEMNDPDHPKEITGVGGGDIICLEYDYGTQEYKIIKASATAFEPVIFDAADEFVAKSRKPLAKIVSAGGVPAVLRVDQYEKSDLARTLFNYSGSAVYGFSSF